MTTNKDIELFPNPVRGILNIKMRNEIRLSTRISLTNILGQEVLNKIVQTQSSEIDISSLPEGIYFLKACNREGVISKRIVKVN